MSFRQPWEEQLQNIVDRAQRGEPLCHITHIGMTCAEFDAYVAEKNGDGIIGLLGRNHYTAQRPGQ